MFTSTLAIEGVMSVDVIVPLVSLLVIEPVPSVERRLNVEFEMPPITPSLTTMVLFPELRKRKNGRAPVRVCIEYEAVAELVSSPIQASERNHIITRHRS